jgi:metallophosphoesterase (TIGR00282 family)
MSVVKILFLGDIVGSSGRQILQAGIPKIREEHKIDLVVANGENAAHGFGLTPQVVKEILATGVDVITGGNHTFDKKEWPQTFSEYSTKLIRPANFPTSLAGRGSMVVMGKSGHKIGVMNLMGRVFMDPLDCPFQTFKREIEDLRRETPIILLDFHGEASSEKTAMAYFVDGQVSAVVGTHTHVQTADDRIFPKGTGFLTDAGMNGALDSVIGIKKEIILERFLKKLPIRMEVAEGPGPLCGVIFSVDSDSGRCVEIERVRRNVL